MSKHVLKIVLTGGPVAGKTTLVSRVLKEFKQEDGWRVITVPETATELISGFGIKPFGGCMSMLAFQDFVIADQIHKEKLALQAAEVVPEENIIILYDRALMDDKAYISDEEFREVIARFDGRTEERVLDNYDAVIHLVTCAKGAEFAYNLGNEARTESLEYAREMDDRTLRAWSGHKNLKIIDNSVDFERKIHRALLEIYRITDIPEPMPKKHKYLIEMPEASYLSSALSAVTLDMTQTYLVMSNPNIERRLRRQVAGGPKGTGTRSTPLYFFTEKHFREDGTKWDTEHPISEKDYSRYLLEADPGLKPVTKRKYCFVYDTCRFEIDRYPFSDDKAILFVYSDKEDFTLPEGIRILKEVTGDPDYKNRRLAARQSL